MICGVKTVKAIHINDIDDCVTLAGSPAEAGDMVCFLEGGAEKTVKAREAVPAWHKMAVNPAAEGAGVRKYGQIIGVATKNIEAGDYVHIHNIRSPGIGG